MTRLKYNWKNILTGKNPPLVIFEFCDWAEKRAKEEGLGKAQQLLRSWEYEVYRLRDFMEGKPSLKELCVEGFETLIAVRQDLWKRLP